MLRRGAGGFAGRSTQAAGELLGFEDSDGAWRDYKSDCDQMFGGGDRDGRRRHRQLRPRDDMLGHGDFRGVWVGHLVLADVAVHCRQQHGAEYREEQGFECVLHGLAPGRPRLLFGEGEPGWFNE